MRPSVFMLSQLVLALGPCQAIAAQAPTAARGDHVRLTVPTGGSKPFYGIVESVRADTIVVRTRGGVLSAFALDQVSRLDLSRGIRRPTWSKTAPLWMPLAGAGLGAIGGGAKPASRSSAKESAGLAAAVGGVLGLVAGVITAIAVCPGDQWDTVLPVRSASRASLAPSLHVAPATHGLRLGLRAAF